jgi:hypothetical protein
MALEPENPNGSAVALLDAAPRPSVLAAPKPNGEDPRAATGLAANGEDMKPPGAGDADDG